MSGALLALPFGLAIGILLGLVGGGGSILAVPALVYVLGQPIHAATIESLFVVGAAALVGAADHARIGNVRIKTAPEFCALELQRLRDERTDSQRSSRREQRPITTAASGSTTGALPRARVTARQPCPE